MTISGTAHVLVETLVVRFCLLLEMITIVIVKVSQSLGTFAMTHYGLVKDVLKDTHVATSVVCHGLN